MKKLLGIWVCCGVALAGSLAGTKWKVIGKRIC
jgi:hypothetical protein